VPPQFIYSYSWTGFYLGANAGFGTINSSNAGGVVWGGTIGYNQQIGKFVVGFEGDYDWSNIRATSVVGPCGASSTGCQMTNNWITTVRGRIGYAFDRYLPYFTGGLAYGNVKMAADFGSDVGNRSGYAIGGGLEYAIGSHWTAKAEYLFVNLSDHNCNTFCGSPPVPLAGDFKQNFIRMGLNYKFDGPTFYNSSR
jgi:outer membrane immunogenic protein